ncbi:MAG: prepilin-type N-terminal cleavage/methylation domain-containing protein, partial [Pseudomonadales bacterium]|nr:prepilin-type N-terminal cleavage/methylation domain-containing protein [Pseudomonadales bacterium]
MVIVDQVAVPTRRREDGFSLVEMLIATALVGLLTLTMFTSIRTASQSWKATDRNLSASDETLFAQSIIRKAASQISPRITQVSQ